MTFGRIYTSNATLGLSATPWLHSVRCLYTAKVGVLFHYFFFPSSSPSKLPSLYQTHHARCSPPCCPSSFSLSLRLLPAPTPSPHVGRHHVPRARPPAGWDTSFEAYDVYHIRYLALGCMNQHGTPFFDSCCRPLLAWQSADRDLPARCAVCTVFGCPSTSDTATDDDEDNDEK
ncbi:Barwin-like endoglucanase [Mycena venus]|uniref:Barwin-like endoglucanase n=1 Tax=Mycena venus TaxID=2733690 RepID=A0A8H6Y6C3_9AGAR|nr:Barwin-like endoglucanase [Mycena venus]